MEQQPQLPLIPSSATKSSTAMDELSTSLQKDLSFSEIDSSLPSTHHDDDEEPSSSANSSAISLEYREVEMIDVVEEKLDVFFDESLNMIHHPSSPSFPLPEQANLDVDMDGIRVLGKPLFLNVLKGFTAIMLWLQPWLQWSGKKSKVVDKPGFYGLQCIQPGYVMPFGSVGAYDLFLYWEALSSAGLTGIVKLPDDDSKKFMDSIITTCTEMMEEPWRSRFRETPKTIEMKKSKIFASAAWTMFSSVFPSAWKHITNNGDLKDTKVDGLRPQLLAVSFGGKENIHSSFLKDGISSLNQMFEMSSCQNIWIAIGISQRYFSSVHSFSFHSSHHLSLTEWPTAFPSGERTSCSNLLGKHRNSSGSPILALPSLPP